MSLKHDPFPLIFASGDDFTKLVCLELFELADSPRAGECLLNLIKQQRSDGAFPSGFDPQTWGMQETIRHTLLFLKIGLPPTGVNVEGGVQFVLDRQNPDGGWRPFFATASSPIYTALAVKVLILSGMLARENFIDAIQAYND